MRRGITIGIRHGATEPVILAGPEVPLQQQRDEFKAQRAVKTHPDFARISLFDLDDTQSRSARFTPVVPARAEENLKPTPKPKKS